MIEKKSSSDKQTGEEYYTLKCGVSSFCAKYIVAIFHPLELLKTRFQSHDGKSQYNLVPKYKNTLQGIQNIYRSQGLAGLYKGVHISAFVSSFASFCFFSIYEKMKLEYQSNGCQPMLAITYAGTQASVATVLITQPAWVIKTRVLLNTQKKIGQIQNIKKKALQIYRQQKFKGFTKGISLNLFLSFGGALRVYIYQGSKILFQKFISKNVQSLKHLISGGMSKFITTLLSYPFTTVRTRIQQNQYFEGKKQAKYKGIIDISIKILKQQGFLSFYKGLAPNLIRGIPMRSVYFFSYELFKSLLIDKQTIERQKKNKNKNDIFQ